MSKVDGVLCSGGAESCGQRFAAEECGAEEQSSAEEARLIEYLEQHGVSVAGFGVGDARRIGDLAREIQGGFSELELERPGGNLVRCLCIVQVHVVAQAPNGTLQLIETSQVLDDGRIRSGTVFLHEKQRRGEAIADTIQRAFRTRLGISEAAAVAILSASQITPLYDLAKNSAGVSRSYPGLKTRYCVQHVEVLLPDCSTTDGELEPHLSELGLPSGDSFMAVEGRIGLGYGGRVRLWTWSDDERTQTPVLKPPDINVVIRDCDLEETGSGSGSLRSGPVTIGRLTEPEALADKGRFRRCVSEGDVLLTTTTEKAHDTMTGLEEVNRDILAVVAAIASDDKLHAERDRLLHVLRRLSRVENLAKVNVDHVLSCKRTQAKKISRSLRLFIDRNFMNGSAGGATPSRSSSSERLAEDDGRDDNRRGRKSRSPQSRQATEEVFSAGSSLLRRASMPPALPTQMSATSAFAYRRAQFQSLDALPAMERRSENNLVNVLTKILGAEENNETPQVRSSSKELAYVHGEVTRIREIGWEDQWVLDALDLQTKTGNRAVLAMAELLLVPNAEDLCTSTNTMRGFASALTNKYASHPNPFHNGAHASVVCHFTHWLARHGRAWAGTPSWQRVATDVAALAHDVGHFGRNNAFCSNSQHPLALIYNDRSILENMHTATCFSIMRRSDSNIMGSLPGDQWKQFREHVVDLILATDMTNHFSFLGEMRVRVNAEEFAPETNAKDRKMTTQCYIKSADLGHAALPWEMHEQWALLLLKEFYRQGDEERNLQVPLSPMCDRNGTLAEFRDSQKGFLEFVILPLFKELACVTSNEVEETCIATIKSNSQRWVSGETSRKLAQAVGKKKGDSDADNESDSSSNASVGLSDGVESQPVSISKKVSWKDPGQDTP